jgi:hypothetical protein
MRQLRDMDPGLIELFVDGKEDGLPDAGRLDGLGLGQGSVVFMLHREGWCWTEHGKDFTVCGEGRLVATKPYTDGYQLVTGGLPMTEGRHYWEIELTNGALGSMVGAVRPGVDHDAVRPGGGGTYFIYGYDGGLYGSGKGGEDEQGEFEDGDRIGVLLDLDAGWMRFYRNDQRCGPGYMEGITGPLVRAAQVYISTVTALPAAMAPEGVEDADEPRVNYASFSLAQLKDACHMPVKGTARGRHEGGAAGATRGHLTLMQLHLRSEFLLHKSHRGHSTTKQGLEPPGV